MWFYHDQGSRDIWGKYRRSACLNHSPCRGKRLGWLFTMICAAGKHSEAGTEAACQGPMLLASCALWHSPYSDCVSYSRYFLERWSWVSGTCTMEDKFEQKFMRALGRFSSRHLSWVFVPDEWSSLLTCSTFLVNGLYSMCCLDSEGIFTHLERFGKWLEGEGEYIVEARGQPLGGSSCSLLWNLGIELRLSSLYGRVNRITHWAISLDQGQECLLPESSIVAPMV